MNNTQPRFFVPEVIQTSAMDCGPAALAAVLNGFGIPASYARLREVCQTHIDGTSIDTLEDAAVQLGLDAQQLILPADHLAIDDADALPAIVVVRRPTGMFHFVVIWQRHGPFVQLMDPGLGRRWAYWRDFRHDILIHAIPIPAATWRDLAGSEGFLAPLRSCMRALRLPEQQITALIERAAADPSWRGLAMLDAAVRLVTTIVQAGGLAPGAVAASLIETFIGTAGAGDVAPPIPEHCWSVRSYADDRAPSADDLVLVRGAVIIRFVGRLADAPPTEASSADQVASTPQLAPALANVLAAAPPRPIFEIVRALHADGQLVALVLVLALLGAALGTIIEVLLLRGLIQLGAAVHAGAEQMMMLVAVFVFISALFFLELPIATLTNWLGRRLETRLRIRLLEKIPRLSERYFHSRTVSDMAQRAHDLRSLRSIPALAVQSLRLTFQMIFTAIGLLWFDPISGWGAIGFLIVCSSLSYFSNPLLQERDLRVRTYTGGLGQFYLDALLGIVPLRTHSAERSLRRNHEGLLSDWTRASLDLSRTMIMFDVIQDLIATIFVVAMVVGFLLRSGSDSSGLLLLYWLLSLPLLARSLSDLGQQYPALRSRILRLLEPLGAPEQGADVDDSVPASPSEQPPDGMSISFEQVTVQGGGQTILEGIDCRFRAGEHVAIVGPSGAGKTSLVGVLLGWHTPVAGRCLVDGVVLDGARLQSLRREIAWVDPAIQLWNRSLLDNLEYGRHDEAGSLAAALGQADLLDVLARLPDGLQTSLGDGGGLLSGGEGQRVRFGRALHRGDIRLAILDEPFRGLDREQRERLLAQAREYWRGATLLCITHDLSETLSFDRVLVIDGGRIVEDGSPAGLAGQEASRYRQLLDAEEMVRRDFWQDVGWRQIWLDGGVLTDDRQPTVEDGGARMEERGWRSEDRR